ncbi:MAG: hypothetical protein ABI571_04615 [Actinomycetota bacterium]
MPKLHASRTIEKNQGIPLALPGAGRGPAALARAAETYANVLGDEGLAVYRRLAEEVWAKVPPITSRDERDRTHSSFRFNITHMMEGLARVTGDVDALVAVKANDLSHAYHYVQIVELYRDASRFDDALEWADVLRLSF